MVVGRKNGREGMREVFLGLLELHFQRAMTVRLTLESYDAAKVTTALVVFASEDWVGGYKCTPVSGFWRSLSLAENAEYRPHSGQGFLPWGYARHRDRP